MFVVMIASTWWVGQSAKRDTENAVGSVSLLYLDELAGRREQVVAYALSRNISNMETAIGLMTEDDLSSEADLQAYQKRMKQLYTLEKFAFVDTDGLIYTSTGVESDIEHYSIDYEHLAEPQISVKESRDNEKTVIVAVPVNDLRFDGKTLVVCFMEIGMDTMLEGVSLQSDNNGTTFCNIYTKDGTALTDMVLGGLASETNLLDALDHADFEKGASAEKVKDDFENGTGDIVSFTYNGVKETLAYVRVDGTDWMLTYLIRESVISEQISTVSNRIIARSLASTLMTALVLISMFIVMFTQNKRNAQLAIEKEASDTENRIKRQELEQRLVLNEKLLEQEKQRTQQDHMITALASDYRSVYYADLDTDECICYRSEVEPEEGPQVGDKFSFTEAFTRYCNEIVDESCRDGFMQFIDVDGIRKSLEKDRILSYRYLIERDGRQSYEMLRIAGVRRLSDRTDHIVHAVGVGFTDIDAEMRESLTKNRALSEALTAAEEASKAKTSFLSNMSHEIRTPMNAIIGLNSLALKDQSLKDETREYLEKIGGSARHLLGLINDILDMSRIESGRLVLRREEFSFSGMLEQINTMVMAQCRDKGLTYECRIRGHVDDYYIGDDMKLKQILINILSNAIKFTDPPGSVSMTVEKIAQYEDQCSLKFIVKDTGNGISKEFLPKIFDSFTQEDSSRHNKYGSTGLGMAITKNIVEMMNGTISVESEKGVGTEFTVVVSLKNCEHHFHAVDSIDPKELCVLVVDDDAIACEHAKLVLDEAGIRSDLSLSGEEALKMMEVRHAKQEPYNLVLIDWKMPELDGVELARLIRKRYSSETTVIILTAYNWDEIIDEALHAGVDSFLAKPLFASNVIDEFERIARRNSLSIFKEKQRADLGGKRILLAEDIPINAEIVKKILSIKKAEVVHAVNGREAVRAFEESEPGSFSAILMDVRMPEMDGLEAAQKIRFLGRTDAKRVPIIAMTANAFDEDVQRSLQAGMNAHLSKPVDPEHLYRTLEELIYEYLGG